ncbi:MAG TPA: hypothetical protein VGO00_21760, partial [Kofleriaceae bacterium]|nr:hypothetical protein [Kofleriaceae bacterium]
MVVRCVVVAVVMGSTVASADDAAPVAKLLAEPDQLAAWLGDRDPMIESQRAKIAAASATARQTRVIPNPTLNVGVSDFVIGHTNPTTPPLGLGQTLIYTAGIDELIEIGKRGLKLSMRHQVMIERYLKGWKEVEYEVMRDGAG